MVLKHLLGFVFMVTFIVGGHAQQPTTTSNKTTVSSSKSKKTKKKTAKVATPLATNTTTTTPTVPPSASTPPTNNLVRVEPFENNMGTLKQGKPKSATFTVTNNNSVPLVLKDVKGGCGCTTTDYPKEPIAPGKKATFTATYDAAATGEFSKSVKVTTNFDAEPILVIIKGKVVPKS